MPGPWPALERTTDCVRIGRWRPTGTYYGRPSWADAIGLHAEGQQHPVGGRMPHPYIRYLNLLESYKTAALTAEGEYPQHPELRQRAALQRGVNLFGLDSVIMPCLGQ